MKYSYVFFGTPEFSTTVLEEMKKRGFLPSLVVTSPDKPRGRKLIITPSHAKVWAEENAIPVLEPPTLRDEVIQEALRQAHAQFFVVASYGKIIPQEVIDIPEFGILNIHPSLLPLFRGASPIHSSILAADETGASIMLIDEKLDHGPVFIEKRLETNTFPLPLPELEEKLAVLGAELLCDVIPKWVNGEIVPTAQDEEKATFTKKITKKDAELDLLNDPPEVNYRKILAFTRWPKAYFFIKKDGKDIRVVVSDAQIQNEELKLLKVIPEGRGEMTREEFEKWVSIN